jgi:Ca-activated chloride channel family protein
MDSADEVGTRLMRGADEEGVRGMDIAGALEAEGHLDYTTKNEVWSYFYDRKNDMWGYAYDLKNANWGAAYEIKNDAWSEVYETGNTKWSEYYSKSVADR